MNTTYNVTVCPREIYRESARGIVLASAGSGIYSPEDTSIICDYHNRGMIAAADALGEEAPANISQRGKYMKALELHAQTTIQLSLNSAGL